MYMYTYVPVYVCMYVFIALSMSFVSLKFSRRMCSLGPVLIYCLSMASPPLHPLVPNLPSATFPPPFIFVIGPPSYPPPPPSDFVNFKK